MPLRGSLRFTKRPCCGDLVDLPRGVLICRVHFLAFQFCEAWVSRHLIVPAEIEEDYSLPSRCRSGSSSSSSSQIRTVRLILWGLVTDLCCLQRHHPWSDRVSSSQPCSNQNHGSGLWFGYLVTCRFVECNDRNWRPTTSPMTMMTQDRLTRCVHPCAVSYRNIQVDTSGQSGGVSASQGEGYDLTLQERLAGISGGQRVHRWQS